MYLVKRLKIIPGYQVDACLDSWQVIGLHLRDAERGRGLSHYQLVHGRSYVVNFHYIIYCRPILRYQ